jgi:hypothetical protein
MTWYECLLIAMAAIFAAGLDYSISRAQAVEAPGQAAA